MSIADIILCILLLIGVVAGYREGFLMELFSFLALLLGVLGGFKLLGWAMLYLGDHFDVGKDVLPYVAFFVVFIAIVIATILEGIVGALLVVPVLASVVVIAEYIQRRVLGLSPFEDDGSRQFVAPEEKIKPTPRKWTRRDTKTIVDEMPATDVVPVEDSPVSSPNGEAVPAVETESRPRRIPVRKKTQK